MDQAARREPSMESQGYLGNSRVILNHYDAATQANIQHIALSYDSEDESMHRRSRRLPSTPYSKHDIREQYCISERGLGALERGGGGGTGGLFGCLAGAAPNATSPCAAAARGSLLTVCVRRRVPSDENISELCSRRPEDYAPMPRYPRYPWPPAPADLYRYDSDLACSYFRRRPRSLCGASDPSRFTWLPADEEGNRLERPRPVRAADRELRHSTETLHWPPAPAGVCLVHPVPVLPSALVQHGDGSVHRPKHVSFARSHTLTSFDDAVVSIGGGCGGGGTRLARSQERLLDGRKTADPPPITRQPEPSEPPRMLVEKLKRLPMKTQATQTEVCLGRKPVPSAQLTLSPRTIHRVKMVSQGAQTNGMLLLNGRKLMKSYSEAGGKFTNEEIDQIDHEPLQRTQSEEPPRSPFIVKTPSPEPEELEAEEEQEKSIEPNFPQQISRPPTPLKQIAHTHIHSPPQQFSQEYVEPYNQPYSPPYSHSATKASQPVLPPLQILPEPRETREEPKSDHESEDSESKKEIIIDFEPQIPSSPLKKKPLLKTASDGEILLDKRRAQRHDEDKYLPKNLTSISHDNITIEQPETHSFVPYFQNSPIRHEDIFKDLNAGHHIFSSVEESDHNTQSFRAQDSLDEEFHENLIYGGLFRKRSSSSDPEGKTSRNESNSPSPEEDGVVPTLHLLPEQKVSPFASTDSLANDLRDHSDGIWNESQATVLQADSGTENGTGLSASELSSTLSTLSPAAATLLTPSSRRKHLLLLQHQQRSSMDTDALDEESQGEGQTLTPTQPIPRPISPKVPSHISPSHHATTLAPPAPRLHPSPRSPRRRPANTSHHSESSLDLRSLETRTAEARALESRSLEARPLESRSVDHHSLRSLSNGGERAAVVPDLLLARTDSGRTNTDISESTTTDDYCTANSGTDSSRRSTEKDRERHHHHPVTQDGSSFESASSIYPLSEDMVVPSFSPPILEEASDAAPTPVPPVPASRSRSRSASSSSSGSYSLDGACRDPEPVPAPRHAVSVSDEEGGRYSSSGYYESPLEDDTTCKTRGNGNSREWTDEEKRRKKRAFTLEITKHQNTEDQIQKPSTSDKLKSPHSQREKDTDITAQSSPRTLTAEKPLKRTKVRNRSPMQGRRVSGAHVSKRSPTQQVHTPEAAEDVHATGISGPGGTSDESSSGVCGDVQLQVQNQSSPRKMRKIREASRRKSTPRSPTSSRAKRRNGSGDDKPSSLPGSLPRRRPKHDSNEENHSNTLPATKSSRLSPYKSPSGSPKRRSSKTSPEVRLKALSAESLRSVSPGSDSVFYSDPSSHAAAPATEHQVHCLHCGKEVDIVTTDDPDKSNASSNGREADIVQPPAGFADSPRLKHGRLYKKLEKRFRSEERGHAERRHHKYKGDVRAKSEERCMRSEWTPPPPLPRPRSASGGPTHLRSGSASAMLAPQGGDLPHVHAHGGDEDAGVYTEPYRAAQWVYIGEGDEQVAWKKSDPNLHQGSGSGAGGGSSPEMSRQDSLASITSTDSEHEFKKKYQAITHRMVHRKSCLEMYKRQASKSFESDKTIIVHRESGEFGFRIHGSKPVVVSAIEPDTPAESSGLEVGDIVLAVNGVSVLDKSHSEVVKIAHAGSDTLTLEVARTCGVLSPPASAIQESTSLYSGYLWKQGGHVSGTPTNKWIRRWFSLKKDNCLYSYKTDLDQQPVGAMMLTHYQISLLPNVSDTRPNRLCLSRSHSNHKSSHANSSPTSSPPPLYLAADTETAAQRWATVLSAAVEKSNVADQWLENTRRNLAVPPNQVQKPDCFGYLNKLGSKWKTWSRRYCVLKDACMYFYHDANAKYSYGMACLQGYRVQQSTTGGKKHAFEILPSDNSQKHFYFHTESDMDRKRWVAALEYSIDRWLKVG